MIVMQENDSWHEDNDDSGQENDGDNGGICIQGLACSSGQQVGVFDMPNPYTYMQRIKIEYEYYADCNDDSDTGE